MNNVILSLFAALIGALVGAFASILVMVIQLRAQARRERLRMAADVALADYKQTIELMQRTGRSFTATPIVTYLFYHTRLMELIDRGKVTPETIQALQEETGKISAAINSNAQK